MEKQDIKLTITYYIEGGVKFYANGVNKSVEDEYAKIREAIEDADKLYSFKSYEGYMVGIDKNHLAAILVAPSK